MPHSDNLYSAIDDESETESLSHELSPTDGFFTRSPMASSCMVPDPSLDRKDAVEEDKVLIPRSEARNESGSTSRSATSPTLRHLFPSQNYASSQSNTSPHFVPSATVNTASMPSSRRNADNELFPDTTYSMQGPPPAYTPSSPTTSSNSNHNRSYSTVEPARLEQGLPYPSNIEPQSMGRPSAGPNERTPLASNGGKKPSRRRTVLRKFLFIALVFAVVAATISTFMKWRNDANDSNHPGSKWPPHTGLPDSRGSYCAPTTFRIAPTYYDVGLGDKIGIVQETHASDGGEDMHSVSTSGEIRIRKLPKDSKYPPRAVVSIETYVSDERLQVLKTWTEDLRILKVSVPSYTMINSNDNCISLEITIWVPEGASLTELSTAATVLDLRLFDDLKVNITGEANFSTISGNVYFPESMPEHIPPTSYPMDSRHITVETISGDIKGIYPLYDYLKLGSVSGDIQAGIIPQPVLPSEPMPANLEISTRSGTVEINLPVQVPRYTPPARDYVTTVSSVSGDVKGGFFLGSYANLQSTSGDIRAKVLPVVQYSPSTDPDDAPKTKFQTWTISGTQDVEVLEPIFISLLPSNASPSPSTPDKPISAGPYVPIGDDDPYRDIIRPELDENIDLQDGTTGKMMKRRRTATKTWRTLTATHKARSGDISLRYPESWEGTVTESTLSGATKTIGKDIKIISSKSGWPYKELVAGKGVNKVGEGSSTTMTTIAGDLTFAVGDEK